MKLRCIHNSIRLRIRKSEIEQLSQGIAIREEVGFPGETPSLVFSLEMSSHLLKVSASFKNNLIQIVLPKDQAHHWINTDEVSIEEHLPLNDTEELHLLIEKDFPCTDRDSEDKSDFFGELANEVPDQKIC